MAYATRGGGRKRDPMWKHGTPSAVVGEVICNHCMKTMTSGIHRLKYHLAKITGQNSTVCDNCPEEVQRELKERLLEFEQKKAKKRRTTEAISAPVRDLSSTGSRHIEVGIDTSSFFIPRNTPGAQPTLLGTSWNKEVHQ
ncbi:hypothetical protein SUGI_0605240 [Cryptomeria japonica]|nr:hypothetical protein SUGI_0605240 [Cryptomeria japonica]